MGWNDVVKDNSGSSDKTPYTKFESGNTLIRVLDDEPYSFWSHWFQKQKTSAACLGKGCPVCTVIAQMKVNKEKPPYNSTQRHAIRIWNYNTSQMEIMIQGKTFFSTLLDLHKEVGDIRTYDIKVVRKGSDKDNTSYTLLPTAPVEFNAEEHVVQEVNIPEMLSPPTMEEVQQLMEGKTWAEINGTDESGESAA